jgi:immunity protein 49 of polymorphic toxin system
LVARIARHKVDEALSRTRAEQSATMPGEYLKALPRNLSHANMCRSTTQALAADLAAVDPGSDRICEAVRLGAEATAALFAAATAGQGEVQVRLGGQVVRAPAAVDPSVVEPSNWQGGYFLAAICRESALLDVLCKTPAELLRRSSTRGEKFVYLYTEALRAFWRKEDEAPGLLLEALKATDPDQLEFTSADYVLDIVVPQMEVLYRLMDADAAGFNQALEKAVTLHRDYWKKGKRKNDPEGYVSFPLTAFASTAHDGGIPVEVESDYLPERLVQGDCRA